MSENPAATFVPLEFQQTSKIPPGQSSSKEKEKSKNRDTSTADEPGKSEWGRRRQGKRNSLKRLAKKFR